MTPPSPAGVDSLSAQDRVIETATGVLIDGSL
jgi:hypothetical protein